MAHFTSTKILILAILSFTEYSLKNFNFYKLSPFESAEATIIHCLKLLQSFLRVFCSGLPLLMFSHEISCFRKISHGKKIVSCSHVLLMFLEVFSCSFSHFFRYSGFFLMFTFIQYNLLISVDLSSVQLEVYDLSQFSGKLQNMSLLSVKGEFQSREP